MTTRQVAIRQDDFSAGAITAVAPHLIPPNAVEKLRNGLLDDGGSIYRRGGAVPKSNGPFGVDVSRLTFVWNGQFPAGVRTLFASPDAFGVLGEDDNPIELGGGGLVQPRPAAHVGGYLFVGGHIYAGSLKDAAYDAGTVSVTEGSRTVTGTSTLWRANADEGMLFQIGDERVYAVESVDSDTQITLAEPYEGSTNASASYTLHPIYEIRDADPYPASDIYCVVQGRLCWAEGRFLRFAPLSELGFPDNHGAWADTDEHEFPEEIIGLADQYATLFVFSRAGTWAVQGVRFDVVDAVGNPQHTIEHLSDHVLLDGAGIAKWDQRLICPMTDGVYLIDGVGEPRLLSANIRPDYIRRVRLGDRAGGAAVYASHYILPMLSGTGAVRRVFVLRLDPISLDRRRRTAWPWSWFDGNGAEVACLAPALSDDRRPLLLGAGANSAARILDCSTWFEPSAQVATDPDGSAHECDVFGRAFETGGGTKNAVRWLRLFYELTGPGKLQVSWTDGSPLTGQPKWNQVLWNQFKWAADGSGFIPLRGDLGSSDGVEPKRIRVNKRRHHIRFRLRTVGACHSFVLRGLQLDVRPSAAVRR